MSRRNLIILGLLLLTLIGGGYVWHSSQDEQQIHRQLDQMLMNIEHKKISLRKPEDVREALREVFATDEVEFSGPDPIPNGPLPLEDIISSIEMLHQFSASCTITEGERSLRIKGNQAQAVLDLAARVFITKRNDIRQNWTLIVDLEKSDIWRVTRIAGEKN